MLCVIELDLGSASGLWEFVYLAPFSQVAIHVNFYFVHMKAEDHMVCGLFIHHLHYESNIVVLLCFCDHIVVPDTFTPSLRYPFLLKC